jgi:dCMP deaminase
MSGALVALTEPSPREEMLLQTARAAASFSTCKRRQVGAAIIGPDDKMIAMGYNSMNPMHGSCGDGDCPRGNLSYDDQPKDVGYTNPDAPCHALHAEEWAVINAMGLGATLYILRQSFIVVTHKPCPNCERFIRGVGLQNIVYDDRG